MLEDAFFFLLSRRLAACSLQNSMVILKNNLYYVFFFIYWLTSVIKSEQWHILYGCFINLCVWRFTFTYLSGLITLIDFKCDGFVCVMYVWLIGMFRELNTIHICNNIYFFFLKIVFTCNTIDRSPCLNSVFVKYLVNLFWQSMKKNVTNITNVKHFDVDSTILPKKSYYSTFIIFKLLLTPWTRSSWWDAQ